MFLRRFIPLALGMIVLLVPVYHLHSRERAEARRASFISAGRRGDTAMVVALMGQGLSAEVDDERGFTVLEIAAMAGHAETVRAMLDRGARPDGRDQFGQTPLLLASGHGRTAIVSLLLCRGAEVN